MDGLVASLTSRTSTRLGSRYPGSPAPVKKARSQLSYVLEARDSYSKEWTKIASNVAQHQYCVEELDPRTAHTCSGVRAESESGISEPGRSRTLLSSKMLVRIYTFITNITGTGGGGGDHDYHKYEGRGK